MRRPILYTDMIDLADLESQDLKPVISWIRTRAEAPLLSGGNRPANVDLFVQMHYAPSLIDQIDSSTLHLFFLVEPDWVSWGEETANEVYCLPILDARCAFADEDIVFEEDPILSAEGEHLWFPQRKVYPIY